MIRQRVRIRFRKEGDLRWISHRDLARAFERLFRRMGLRLSMSEGFHPKARMSFPSALGLGIAAMDEVMEFELAERADQDVLAQKFAALAPPGLVVFDVQVLKENTPKAKIAGMSYEAPVPPDRRDAVAQAIERIAAEETWRIEREDRSAPLDLKADLESLELDEGAEGPVVRFRLAATREATVRPREVLAAVGLSDLEDDGACLTRTRVELAP
ncbi:MAG: TIGR03936 family radical SAM-associated protein [Planctomycetes bacterium]|nr:TIGR03936 family radical SAM-associated protein [Planctomycetota bacterium]